MQLIKKHPVLAAFGIAAMMSLGLLAFWMVGSRIDERPFIAAGAFLMFPVLWFLTWIVINGVNWWRESAGKSRE